MARPLPLELSRIDSSNSSPSRRSSRLFYFTIDCDWVPGSERGLEALLNCCDRYGVVATVFFAGRFAESYPELVRESYRRGHQLGTHGWAHGGLVKDEDFRRAGYELQRLWIRRATEAVEKAAGVRPVVFRAPNLWIGETTWRALEDEGYHCDSSIPSRRFDFGFGRVHYLKYFWAPTTPYRPCTTDLGTPGRSKILEVPPSACLFPVNLATLRVLGLSVVSRMATWIAHTSGHLVFYCHPAELVQAKDQRFPSNMSWWNRRGMGPQNLILVERFLEYALSKDFVPSTITPIPLPRLDSSRMAILRAEAI